MGTVLQGLDAFESELAPQPRPSQSTATSGTGVLMSVVDDHPGKNSYAGGSRRARHFERILTVGRLVALTVRGARLVAFFPFVVVGWFLRRIWWGIRLLLTATWHALVGTPDAAVRPPVVKVAIAGVPSWARDVPLVPAITLVLTATAGLSVALSLLLLRF